MVSHLSKNGLPSQVGIQKYLIQQELIRFKPEAISPKVEAAIHVRNMFIEVTLILVECSLLQQIFL